MPDVDSVLLLESGDFSLLESGDSLLLEDSNDWIQGVDTDILRTFDIIVTTIAVGRGTDAS